MTPRQVHLIAQLANACWNHNEKRGSEILLELLGPQINEQIKDKVSAIMEREGHGRKPS